MNTQVRTTILASSIRRVLGYAATVLTALAAVPALSAEFECKQELMAGTWVHHSDLWILDRDGGDAFPPAGPYSTTGVQVFDEQGRASIARQTASTSEGFNRANFLNAFDVRVTISPDCTGRWIFALRNDLPAGHPLISQRGFQPGQIVFDLDIVCSNAQQECSGTFTNPEGVFTGIGTLRRIETFNALLEAKVDSLTEKINAIMQRLGLVPSAFGSK